ncbi:hypothetical protein [Moritella marina]|uniref:hypothetical protein n=1 Tax=Moritella marina TaxID=90736 RepID=UPI0037037D13
MLKNLILIAISIAFPPLFFFTVPYLIYLFFTYSSRREKYFNDAIIWRTGGLLRTGDINIHKSVSLYKKASSMGHAEAAFHLGEMYCDGISPFNHTGYLLEPNSELANMYFKQCLGISPSEFEQLSNQREKMLNEIREKYNFTN